MSSSKEITILDSEINGLVHSSKKLAEEIKAISKKEKIKVKIKEMPFGGGSTDAGSFAKHHIKTTSIIAMPLDTKHGVHYHNSSDTVQNIDKKVITKILNILVKYIEEQDKK